MPLDAAKIDCFRRCFILMPLRCRQRLLRRYAILSRSVRRVCRHAGAITLPLTLNDAAARYY